MIEWQSESSLFTLRVRAKQWYWVYKIDLRNVSDIFSAPRNIGSNKWRFATFGDIQTADNYLQISQLRAYSNWSKTFWNNFVTLKNPKLVKSVHDSSVINAYRQEYLSNAELTFMFNRSTQKYAGFKKRWLGTQNNQFFFLEKDLLSEVFKDSFSDTRKMNTYVSKQLESIDEKEVDLKQGWFEWQKNKGRHLQKDLYLFKKRFKTLEQVDIDTAFKALNKSVPDTGTKLLEKFKEKREKLKKKVTRDELKLLNKYFETPTIKTEWLDNERDINRICSELAYWDSIKATKAHLNKLSHSDNHQRKFEARKLPLLTDLDSMYEENFSKEPEMARLSGKNISKKGKTRSTYKSFKFGKLLKQLELLKSEKAGEESLIEASKTIIRENYQSEYEFEKALKKATSKINSKKERLKKKLILRHLKRCSSKKWYRSFRLRKEFMPKTVNLFRLSKTCYERYYDNMIFNSKIKNHNHAVEFAKGRASIYDSHNPLRQMSEEDYHWAKFLISSSTNSSSKDHNALINFLKEEKYGTSNFIEHLGSFRHKNSTELMKTYDALFYLKANEYTLQDLYYKKLKELWNQRLENTSSKKALKSVDYFADFITDAGVHPIIKQYNYCIATTTSTPSLDFYKNFINYLGVQNFYKTSADHKKFLKNLEFEKILKQNLPRVFEHTPNDLYFNFTIKKSLLNEILVSEIFEKLNKEDTIKVRRIVTPKITEELSELHKVDKKLLLVRKGMRRAIKEGIRSGKRLSNKSDYTLYDSIQNPAVRLKNVEPFFSTNAKTYKNGKRNSWLEHLEGSLLESKNHKILCDYLTGLLLNATHHESIKHPDHETDGRIIKRSMGSVNPLRILKNPSTDLFFVHDHLNQDRLDMLRLKFNEKAHPIAEKPINPYDYLTFKQKRYNIRTDFTFKKLLFNYKTGNYKKFEKNPFLKDLAIVKRCKDEVPNVKDNFKMVQKAKKRTDSTRVASWNRLLRSRRVLVLPAHVNITVITNSFDIVHSWHIPGLGLKMDCLPGRATHHTLYIDNVGLYYGQCAEVCGRYHHHMPIRVCALPFEHFLVWWHTFGLPKFLFPDESLREQALLDKKFARYNRLKPLLRQFSW